MKKFPRLSLALLALPGMAQAHSGHGLNDSISHAASHSGEPLLIALILAAAMGWLIKHYGGDA